MDKLELNDKTRMVRKVAEVIFFLNVFSLLIG